MEKKVFITKSSGEKAEYDPTKVYHAVARSGASEELAEEIVRKVSGKVQSGWSTKQIFDYTFGLLKKARPKVASKYDLRGAIMRLGPSGYAFELFVSEVLKGLGYSVKTNQILEGRCISHEVDIVAEKAGERLMVECKFHNQPSVRCNAQAALYTYARFLDLTEGKEKFTEPMLVTNTKFSTDLIDYAQCRGMRLMGWKYPLKQSLEHLVDEYRLYPITVLHNLDDVSRERLLRQGITLARQISETDNKALHEKTGIAMKSLWVLGREAEELYA